MTMSPRTQSRMDLAEGIAAGLVRVEFTQPHAPREYSVSVTNGSGTRSVKITATSQTTASTWATRWAATLGPAWYCNDVTSTR